MKRRDFLHTCSGGLCACATAGLLAPLVAGAAKPKPADDWRTGFVQERYAKLLEILAGQLPAAELDETLRQLGRFCASRTPTTEKYRGRIDDFIRENTRGGDTITYDREKGVITVVGPERDSCFCPLVSVRRCPHVACNCTLGWQQQTYETILGQSVEVTLKESVLRGGKRCSCEIRIRPSTTG